MRALVMWARPRAPSVQRHLRIHRPRPSVDSTAHGLNLLISLLTEPIGHAQRAHAVMTHDDNMIVRSKFLVSARGNVSHWNVLRPFDAGGFVFPQLTNIDERECFSALLQRFDLSGRDVEVHNLIL